MRAGSGGALVAWLHRAALACLVPISACYMPLAAGEHLQVEVAALRHDVGTLERRLAESQAQQAEESKNLRGQVLALNQTVGKISNAAKVADADMGSQLERMVQDVQMLRGAVEDNAHMLGEAQTQQNKLTQELTLRIAALQTPSAQASKERPTLSAAALKDMPGSKKERLAYGMRLLTQAERTQDGRNILAELAKKYARERGVGDEAMFALGQFYWADKKYDLAQRELIRLVDAQPKSPRVAEAFLRLADCSSALGKLEDAQTFLSEVVSNHRQSKVFKEARLRLNEVTLQLGRKQAPAAAPQKTP